MRGTYAGTVVIDAVKDIVAALRERSAGEWTTMITEDFVKGQKRDDIFEIEGKEILVGITNRKESHDVYATLKKDEYVIKFVGDKLVIIGFDEYATSAAVAHFIEAYLSGSVETLEIALETEIKGEASLRKIAVNNEADYRIMTMNIQDHKFNTALERYDALEEVVKYTSVDVIGFQEFCVENAKRLIPLLKAQGYTVIHQEVYTGSSDGSNRVPLAYKTSKFSCLAKGWKQLPGGDNRFGVTWAVLKNKTTSETFGVTTTHFYNVGVLEDKVIIRQDNTKMVLSVTNDIIKTYGCEVINMGDYNMRSFDKSYHMMVDSGVLADTRFTSFRDGIMVRVGHSLGSSVPSEGSASRTIDFFFATSKVNALRTRAVVNMASATSTDHSPVYTDISFVK